MEGHYYSNTKIKLFYKQYGKGKKAMLAFHGFGQTHEAFQEYSQVVDTEYTVYSFDLPFHGNSKWQLDEVPLNKHELYEIIQSILVQHNIERVSVMGFSLGAKFALSLMELMPNKIDALVLIAPDGIQINRWYTLATSTSVTRQVFKTMIQQSSLFYSVASFAFRTKLIDKSQLKFVESQMNNETKREKVYYSWVVFRKLRNNISHLAELINKYSIKTSIVIGKNDTIIKPKSMNKLLSKLNDPDLLLLDTGHNQVMNKWVTLLKKQ